MSMSKEEQREYNRKYYLKNREKAKAEARANYYENRAQIRAKQREYREANKEQVRAVNQLWMQANKDRLQAYHSEYREHNKARKYVSNAQRRAQEKRATPAWADPFEMECVYKLRMAYQAIGLDVHVDHIVPLNGKTVCGLHTPDNLRIISAEENLRKNRYHWPDMP